jgi:glucokinase
MRRVLKREALPQTLRVCEIVPAQLGEQIGDVAALCVAMGLEGRWEG